MGTAQGPDSRGFEARPACPLFEEKHSERDLLSGQKRVRLADATSRFTTMENLLLLLHGMEEGRGLADNPHPTPGYGACAKRKKKAPTAAIIDSQSVKSANHPGGRGYDAGKRIMGRKRHLLVDTMGLVLLAMVHSGNIQDRDGGRLLLAKLERSFGWLQLIWADGGYAGKLVEWIGSLRRHRNTRLEIVRRADQQKGFKVLPKRWIVERTFAWLTQARRLNKDYETSTESAEAFIYIAMIRNMTRRLA